MAEFQTTFDVDGAPDDVVAYLSDLTNLPEWDSSVRRVELASDTGPAVGRRFDVTVGFYGRELDAVYEITDFDCHASVGWAIDGKAAGSTHITVTPSGSGSTIDYRLQVSMKGVARLLDRGLNLALEGIGDNVEAGLRNQFRR